MDRLAEKFENFTPYQYAGNNPVLFIDPDGMEALYNSLYSQNMSMRDQMDAEMNGIRGMEKFNAQSQAAIQKIRDYTGPDEKDKVTAKKITFEAEELSNSDGRVLGGLKILLGFNIETKDYENFNFIQTVISNIYTDNDGVDGTEHEFVDSGSVKSLFYYNNKQIKDFKNKLGFDYLFSDHPRYYENTSTSNSESGSYFFAEMSIVGLNKKTNEYEPLYTVVYGFIIKGSEVKLINLGRERNLPDFHTNSIKTASKN